MKLYEFRITSIRQLDDAPGWPAATVVEAMVSLAPLNQAKVGHEIALTLRFPRDDTLPLSTLRELVAAEVPKVLGAASDLSRAHIPQNGDNVRNADGFGS